MSAFLPVAAALTAAAAVVMPPTAPAAHAADCNDVEVVFARGTSEDPGIGRVGDAFVNDLRGLIGNRSLGVYAVNYPASYDFLAVADGANDGSGHIQWVANNCPNTKIVLGGYSQGAAVVDVVTSVPVPGIGFTNPLPPPAAYLETLLHRLHQVGDGLPHRPLVLHRPGHALGDLQGLREQGTTR